MSDNVQNREGLEKKEKKLNSHRKEENYRKEIN